MEDTVIGVGATAHAPSMGDNQNWFDNLARHSNDVVQNLAPFLCLHSPEDTTL